MMNNRYRRDLELARQLRLVAEEAYERALEEKEIALSQLDRAKEFLKEAEARVERSEDEVRKADVTRNEAMKAVRDAEEHPEEECSEKEEEAAAEKKNETGITQNEETEVLSDGEAVVRNSSRRDARNDDNVVQKRPVGRPRQRGGRRGPKKRKDNSTTPRRNTRGRSRRRRSDSDSWDGGSTTSDDGDDEDGGGEPETDDDDLLPPKRPEIPEEPVLDVEEAEKIAEEEEADKKVIYGNLPKQITDRFLECGFAKWDDRWLPCLELGPFDIRGKVREDWMGFYHNFIDGRKKDMPRLVYWYGVPKSRSHEAISYVPPDCVVPYEIGVDRGYSKLPQAIEKKLHRNKKLKRSEQEHVLGLVQIEEDVQRWKENRMEWMKEKTEVLVPVDEDENADETEEDNEEDHSMDV